ncbi:MAG TPA: hypothetical protein VMP68_23080 [Candidatus Eisenbacteria bacterium]|nr:hypothetical protein [Candidatus Eisenbacteria bacterium]
MGRWSAALVFGAVISVMLLSPSSSLAQRPSSPRTNTAPAQTSEKDLTALQDQFLQLLRMSPTLAEVVARDPSLLSNQDYVERNNPALANFLKDHPDIAQNPDFYLFNNLHPENEQPSEALERKLWPQLSNRQSSEVARELISTGAPFLVFLCILGALLWLIHVLLENRRWNRIFNLQTDVHGKLIDRFATSQEVLTYMGTDAGKKFLEATPIAVGFEKNAPVPSPVARVLTPLQIGLVMTLLGVGLVSMRNALPDAAPALMLLGTIVLMPGLGFIISAGITWVLARRLGLIPNQGPQS